MKCTLIGSLKNKGQSKRKALQSRVEGRVVTCQLKNASSGELEGVKTSIEAVDRTGFPSVISVQLPRFATAPMLVGSIQELADAACDRPLPTQLTSLKNWVTKRAFVPIVNGLSVDGEYLALDCTTPMNEFLKEDDVFLAHIIIEKHFTPSQLHLAKLKRAQKLAESNQCCNLI